MLQRTRSHPKHEGPNCLLISESASFGRLSVIVGFFMRKASSEISSSSIFWNSVALLLLVVAGAPEASAMGLSQWLISPKDGSIGPINAKTSEADLIRIFGRSNVSRGDVSIEGAAEKGTILFRGNKQKEIYISWKDRSKFKNPAMVFVTWNTINLVPGMRSIWRLEHGITIGTTLKELQKLNRRPFQLSGITKGACSGSEIVSWQGGQLEKELNGRVKVSLTLTASEEKQKQVTSAEWDHTSNYNDVFSSKDDVMQKLDPAVYFLSASFK